MAKSRIASKTFDYGQLDGASWKFVQDARDEIRRLGKQTAENIIAIGRHLTEVKERLPYGQYGAWLEAEFPSWSERHARRFMNSYALVTSDIMAEVSEADLPKLLENLSPTAMYALAEPSTPNSAREEVVDRVVRGEILPPKEVKEIVDRHRPWHPKQRSPEAMVSVADIVAKTAFAPASEPTQSISPYARPASDKPSVVTITPDMVDPVLRLRGLLQQALRVVEADGTFQATVRALLVDLIDAVKAEEGTRPIRLPLQRP